MIFEIEYILQFNKRGNIKHIVLLLRDLCYIILHKAFLKDLKNYSSKQKKIQSFI